MTAFLLHQGASVSCIHQGTATPSAPDPRVKVDGKPVVTQPVPHTVSGCPFTTPAGNPLPCVTAQWTTAALRVRAGGRPVLLSDSQATCVPNGTGVVISSTQTRVRGA